MKRSCKASSPKNCRTMLSATEVGILRSLGHRQRLNAEDEANALSGIEFDKLSVILRSDWCHIKLSRSLV